jgi:hypothetical protein
MLGSGMIFPIKDEDLMEAPREIPHWWSRINGIDFGIDHPAAGAFCAIERTDDNREIFHVYDVYKRSGETPVYHASAMKNHGDWIPNAWPHDGMQREKGSNIRLKDLYRAQGLYMLPEHAQNPNVDNDQQREASLIEMYEYMRTGRFKVWSTCTQFFEEKRFYHRKDGKVVALKDDIVSAARYAFMMRRFARTKPTGHTSQVPKTPIIGGAPWRRAI